MKVVTVVGARPQFVKAAMVSKELRNNNTEILVHTGQHFDYNMSERFFEELNIPKPDYNLGISGGTHAQMVGKMLVSIEEVLMKEKPDWLLIYGDTNSTLAAALAAAKLHIPICHVEAGARTHSMTNPEEINRVCTDHISTLLLASAPSCMSELKHEGLIDRAYFVGDPMFDAFNEFSTKKSIKDVRLKLVGGEKIDVPDEYYYLTCHREENTWRDEDLTEILKAMNQLESPTIYPVHPRNKDRALKIQRENGFDKVIMTDPVGYLESMALVRNSKKIVTDSGGLQREAFFAEKKCVTVLNFVSWPETMKGGRNILAHPISEEIVHRLSLPQEINKNDRPFGDGSSGRKIVKMLEEHN